MNTPGQLSTHVPDVSRSWVVSLSPTGPHLHTTFSRAAAGGGGGAGADGDYSDEESEEEDGLGGGASLIGGFSDEDDEGVGALQGSGGRLVATISELPAAEKDGSVPAEALEEEGLMRSRVEVGVAPTMVRARVRVCECARLPPCLRCTHTRFFAHRATWTR